MSGITIQLKGDRDLKEALASLRDDISGNPIKRAVRTAADQLRSTIISFAPRDTYRLIANIALSMHNSGGFTRGRVTVATEGNRYSERNSFYWRFLEMGWTDPAGVPHQMQFIAPAMEAEGESAAQTVIDVVTQAVEKAEARSGRRSEFLSEMGAE